MQVKTLKPLLDKGKVIPAGTVVDLDPETVTSLGAAVELVGNLQTEKKGKGSKSKPDAETKTTDVEPSTGDESTDADEKEQEVTEETQPSDESTAEPQE